MTWVEGGDGGGTRDGGVDLGDVVEAGDRYWVNRRYWSIHVGAGSVKVDTG